MATTERSRDIQRAERSRRKKNIKIMFVEVWLSYLTNYYYSSVVVILVIWILWLWWWWWWWWHEYYYSSINFRESLWSWIRLLKFEKKKSHSLINRNMGVCEVIWIIRMHSFIQVFKYVSVCSFCLLFFLRPTIDRRFVSVYTVILAE